MDGSAPVFVEQSGLGQYLALTVQVAVVEGLLKFWQRLLQRW
jgi:hypothetical protein